LIDGDGDTAGNTFTITIDPATRPMVVRDDSVVTNQTSITIPDWALLANDSGPNSSTQAITAVSSPEVGDTGTHPSNVLYTDVNTNGGSFIYTNTAGPSSDAGSVGITRDATGAIDGNFTNEILIGGAAVETINGNLGDDILIGNGGADTLIGGDGNDTIAGDQGVGAGNDTLAGGNGADIFVLDGHSTALNVGAGGTDIIQDFQSGLDQILVDVVNLSFPLSSAQPVGSQFNFGGDINIDPAAWSGGGTDRLYYDTTTRDLWYSASGTGADKIDLAHMATGVTPAEMQGGLKIF
jgi:Ca2+-binding RTX toxin-like protein